MTEIVHAIFRNCYWLMVLSLGLLLICFVDSKVRLRIRLALSLVAVLNLSVGIMSAWEGQLGLAPQVVFARVPMQMYGYMVLPLLVLIIIWIVIGTNVQFVFLCSLECLNIVIYATALFSNATFEINAENQLVKGPLWYTCSIVATIYLVILLILMIAKHGGRWHRADLLLVFSFILVVVSNICDILLNYRSLPECITLGVLVFYLYLHIESYDSLLKEQTVRLEEKNNALMMSQIQPHFLYNTLNTIYYLCKKDPMLAAETVAKFADFLRMNLDSSTQANKLVPVEKELNHVKNYAHIEMLRFDNVRVEYDIQDKDFELPPLIIQPMVENAIKHGVRGKEEGIVWVKTYRSGSDHVIQIIDNGVGFQGPIVHKDDRKHIGLSNVRERVEQICRGTFKIEGARDQGTIVTITIPEKK